MVRLKEYCEQKADEMLSDDDNEETDVQTNNIESKREKNEENKGTADSTKQEDRENVHAGTSVQK